MAAYWEIAAHLAYDVVFLYKYLTASLVFSHPRFLEWEFLSDYAIPDQCLLVSFYMSNIIFIFAYIRAFICIFK